jgi:hypothetical protein
VVQLVHEEDGALTAGLQRGGGLGEQLAQVLDACRDGVEGAEVAARLVGDDVGQRGLAAARRAVKDHRAEPVGLEQPAQ